MKPPGSSLILTLHQHDTAVTCPRHRCDDTRREQAAARNPSVSHAVPVVLGAGPAGAVLLVWRVPHRHVGSLTPHVRQGQRVSDHIEMPARPQFAR